MWSSVSGEVLFLIYGLWEKLMRIQPFLRRFKFTSLLIWAELTP